MKALIVEKDRTIQQSLSLFMERYKKFEVSSAFSMSEGISLFQTNAFDIVLCGDRLPDGNGFEILKEWVKQKPKMISILMTVQSDEWLKQEAFKAGIQGYLVKPFDLKQLEEVIEISNFGMRLPAGQAGIAE